MGLNGLLLTHTDKGLLYFIDLSNESPGQVVEPESIGGGDGMVFDDDGHLYISEFFGNQVSVWNLSVPDNSSNDKLV